MDFPDGAVPDCPSVATDDDVLETSCVVTSYEEEDEDTFDKILVDSIGTIDSILSEEDLLCMRNNRKRLVLTVCEPSQLSLTRIHSGGLQVREELGFPQLPVFTSISMDDNRTIGSTTPKKKREEIWIWQK
jgi:hypothetical protein